MSFYSSSKTKEENNEDNSGISELSDYIRKTFPESPPSLKDFVKNYPRLTKLIDYIHSSLSSGKPLTKDGCNMIELGCINIVFATFEPVGQIKQSIELKNFDT